MKAGGRKGKKKVNKEVARALNKGNIGKQLVASSRYFSTITDPFNMHGEKIPDFVNYPSSTFSLVYRTKLTTGSAGQAAIAFGLAGEASNTSGGLVPIKWTTAVMGNTLYTLGMSNSSAAAGGLFPTATTTAFAANLWSSGTPTVPNAFQKIRLVSAGISVDYLGTALAAKGTLTIVSLPRSYFRAKQRSVTPLTLADIQNAPGVRIIPLNRLSGGTAVYHPLDLKSFDYVDMDTTIDNSSETTEAVGEGSFGGEMYAVIQEAEASAGVQVTYVGNYEGIPRANTLNIVMATPSKSDPLELSSVMNKISQVPKSFEGTQFNAGLTSGKTQLPAAEGPKHQSMTVTKSTAKSDETFMEKMLSGASGLSGVIDKGLEIGKKVAPLAELALSFL